MGNASLPHAEPSDLARSHEEQAVAARNRAAEWDALLALAYIDGSWNVGVLSAAAVTSARWTNAMILRDYGRAEAETDLWFAHPDAVRATPSHAVYFESMRCVAQIGSGELTVATERLIRLIVSGPQSPRRTASDVYRFLGQLLCDLPAEAEPGPELLTLAETMATARKASKSRVHSCQAASFVGELVDKLEWIIHRQRILTTTLTSHGKAPRSH